MAVNSLHRGVLCINIGIKHVFLCFNVCQVPREMFKIEGKARGLQHLPKYLVNVIMH